MRACAIAVVVWCGVARAQPAPPSPSQQRFEAATALEARGQFAAAATALEELARAAPSDPFAADALYEAAVVAEERLSDPAHARALYDEVATRYPANRLSRQRAPAVRPGLCLSSFGWNQPRRGFSESSLEL